MFIFELLFIYKILSILKYYFFINSFNKIIDILVYTLFQINLFY